MLSPTTPAKRIEPVVQLIRSIRASLPPVQAGSAFASCLSGPPRCSLVLRPAILQTAFRRLLSPRLQPLRCLYDCWDGCPVGMTFAGAGLAPAGSTNLRTAHVDQYTRPRKTEYQKGTGALSPVPFLSAGNRPNQTVDLRIEPGKPGTARQRIRSHSHTAGCRSLPHAPSRVEARSAVPRKRCPVGWSS